MRLRVIRHLLNPPPAASSPCNRSASTNASPISVPPSIFSEANPTLSAATISDPCQTPVVIVLTVASAVAHVNEFNDVKPE